MAIVYRNVLGREGLSGGINYWKAFLTNGSETRGSLVSEILNSARTYKGVPKWGWVANKAFDFDTAIALIGFDPANIDPGA